MRWSAVVASFGIGLAAPAAAWAAGGPVPPLQGGTGIGAIGSSARYVAVAEGRDTLVERVTAGSSRVQARIRVAGNFGIPAADFNGSTTGLSADGRTLVLQQFFPNLPARTTELVVVDTRPLGLRKRILLPGSSTVDAISPDGRWLYLIHYPSAYDLTRYEVLAYNLPEGRLLAKPVVDPRDRGEAMTGVPASRVMSPGGRWAYTLYLRPSGEPFVHALDTTSLRAVCIDLPSLSAANLGAARLQLGPGARSLEVNLGGFIGAAINTRTFGVTRGVTPAAPAPGRKAPHDGRASNGGSGPPWALVLVAVAVAAALGAGARRVTRPPAAA